MAERHGQHLSGTGMHRYFMLTIVIVLKGGESFINYRVMFFPDDVTGFLVALGYLKDFSLFIVYQLTQSYFCLYFFT